MKQARPAAILWFERFFFASFAVLCVDLFVHRESFFSGAGGDDELDEIFTITMAFGVIISFAIQFLLWFFIAHRAKTWAKWIYVIFSILGMIAVVSIISDYATSELVFVAITQILILGSLICLFTPAARFWFQSKGLLSEGKNENLSDVFQ